MTEDQLNDIIEDIMTSNWESGRSKILSFATRMCDKQKEICARNALVKQEYTNNQEEVVTNSMQIYTIEKYDSYYFDIQVYCDTQSIINTPYPEELQ